MPIGVWSTSSTRSTCSPPSMPAQPSHGAARRRPRVSDVRTRRLAYSTSRAKRRLARARDAGHDREAAERHAHVHLAQVVQPGLAHGERGAASARRRDARRADDAAARPGTARSATRVRRSDPRCGPRRRDVRRACRRPDPGRSRDRRGGSCPRRARPRAACCPWRAACASASSRMRLSRGCRPIVGSSST